MHYLTLFSRYQGEEGWAPAMFLKRVDSDESSTSAKGKRDTLDIVSFNGGMFLFTEYFTRTLIALLTR